MNEGSISTGMSMPFIMPSRLSASLCGRPETTSRAGMIVAFTVRVSEETSFIPVSGRESESSSRRMARREPSPRVRSSGRRHSGSMSRSPASSPASAPAAGIAARSASGMPVSSAHRRRHSSRRTICSVSSPKAGGAGRPVP